nr:hypothetical protein [Tanacetum cinerariifolium]
KPEITHTYTETRARERSKEDDERLVVCIRNHLKGSTWGEVRS